MDVDKLTGVERVNWAFAGGAGELILFEKLETKLTATFKPVCKLSFCRTYF